MDAYLLPNGNLLVPKRAEGDGILGDGYEEVPPDSPEGKEWSEWYTRTGRPIPHQGQKSFPVGTVRRKDAGWVTMGGRPCAEGQHCGGTPVQLDSEGNIQKGPAGTVGRKPSELPKKRKPLAGPRFTPQSQRETTDAARGSERPGGPGTGEQAPEAGREVEEEVGGPGAPGADQGREDAAQPARRPAARRIPASQQEVNKRLDRYERLFRSKGNEKLAGWMGMLRDHLGKVGADAMLASLGEELEDQEGEDVYYEGGFAGMGEFAEAYLNRVGITPTFQLEEGSPEAARRLSAQIHPETEGAEEIFRPLPPHLTNKLEEAQNLPGLEKSEDIHKIMGKEVSHLNADVIAKMDERYGKGKWIIKAYGSEAFAGFGIFFPQRVEQIKRDAQNAVWFAGEKLAQYGFRLARGKDGTVEGLVHESGDTYAYGSDEYDSVIQGDARHWAEQARLAADNEQGPKLPVKDFMAQPAFEAVGVSDADRAAGKTIAPGEGRVHIVTRNGKAELVPHSTWIKGEWLPVVFEDDETRAMAQAAMDAINALPEKARQNQIYAPDIIKTTEGYRVIEANPSDPETGSSGYLEDSPFIIDAYTSHLTGRTPMHVRFIRKLLSLRNKEEGKALWYKILSAFDTTRGGALVPPPQQGLRKKAPRFKGLPFVGWKDAGQPCKPGESAERTGCIPAGGGNGKPASSQAPSSEPEQGQDLSKPSALDSEPATPEFEQNLEQQSASKVKQILSAAAALPGKLVPQRVKNAVSKVGGLVQGFLEKRYGKRSAGLILKVAAYAAPIPVPGSHPLAVAVSLVVAEGVRTYQKIRGTFPALETPQVGKALEGSLSVGVLRQAAQELLTRIENELVKQTGGAFEEQEEGGKSLPWFIKAKGPAKSKHPVGVPFRGPSGRWFVVNPQGRTVPSKAPGAGAAGGGKPAAGQQPTPGAAPAMPTAGTPQAAVLANLQAGIPLSATELTLLPSVLSAMTTKELVAFGRTVGIRIGIPPKPQLVSAVLNYAQTASGAPAASPTPAAPTPAPAPAAVPAPSAPLTPGTYWVQPGSGPSGGITWEDRDAIDDVVEEELNKMGKKPDDVLSWSERSQLESALRAKADPSAWGISGWIDRSLNSLKSQLATKLIAPIKLYSKGHKRGQNTAFDDNARPNLKPDEKGAMAAYTGTAYRALNKSLRDFGNPTPRTQQIHAKLQGIFRKTPPLTKPVTVHRRMEVPATALSAFIANLQAAQSAGVPWKSGGYQSTSTRSNLGHNPNDNVVLKINAVHGLDMKPYSHCPQADEFLMDNDTELVITKMYQDGAGVWQVEADQKLPTYATGVAPVKPKVAKPKPSMFSYLVGAFKGIPAAAPIDPTTGKVTPTPIPKDVTKSRSVQAALDGTKTHDWHTNTAGGKRDTFIEDVMAETGKADKPKVVDKTGLDQLKAQGWKIFYRGVKDKAHNDQFKTGDLYVGSGIYGNGNYAAGVMPGDPSENSAKYTAQGYAGGPGTGDVMRIAMPPSAKIAAVSTIKGKIKKFQKEVDAEYAAGNIDYSQRQKLEAITKDPGRFAALLNYDAIDASKGSRNYFVLLNRSDLVVEDTDYSN